MQRHIKLQSPAQYMHMSNVFHRIAETYSKGKTASHSGTKRAALVAKTKALIYSDVAYDLTA